MEIDPVVDTYYRYQFRDFLQKKADTASSERMTERNMLIADVYQAAKPSKATPPAPMDPGEIKHALVDEPAPQEADSLATEAPDPLYAKDDSWQTDSALKYTFFNNFGIPVVARQELEAEVRRCKKSNRSCPHQDKNGICSALFFRCGERHQFGVKETLEQRNMTHRCHYVQNVPAKYILIVDTDKNIREFCRSTLEIFFHYETDKVVTVDSAVKAIDMLNRFKQDNRLCGLAVIAAEMPGMNGYELVNELFERNFNIDVIMTTAVDTAMVKPPDFLGDTLIVAQKAMVAHTLAKPFHSEALITALRTVKPDFNAVY
jgi:CheY-like chemotaxis protein